MDFMHHLENGVNSPRRIMYNVSGRSIQKKNRMHCIRGSRPKHHDKVVLAKIM